MNLSSPITKITSFILALVIANHQSHGQVRMAFDKKHFAQGTDHISRTHFQRMVLCVFIGTLVFIKIGEIVRA